MSAAHKLREPTGAITAEPARIKLAPLGTPLRALARAHTDGRLVLEAELPWLQLGADCTAELSDGRSVEGTVHWIGLDMTRSGNARLRILVDTKRTQSIQLSVHDADVQELVTARPHPKPRRRLIPILVASILGLAALLAWRAQPQAQPKLLEEPPPTVERLVAPPPSVKIPAQPPAAEAAPAAAPKADEAPKPAVTRPAKTTRKAARKHR